MSTIGITPTHGLRVGAPVTRLRLTVRGRRVLLALAALPLAIGITLAAWGGVSAVASAEGAEAVVFETITVLPGDTLWALAAHVAPGEDPRVVVDTIVRLNRLDGGAIFAGQELAIPFEYAGGSR